MIKFSILITTKNRITDLQYILIKSKNLLNGSDVECMMTDLQMGLLNI
jgi:hypothetical protein